jgi:hypothetical protein
LLIVTATFSWLNPDWRFCRTPSGCLSGASCLGFLIVIVGRMQLFTENTIKPILSLLLEPTGLNLAKTARLWGIVFAANLVGCVAAALVLVYGHILYRGFGSRASLQSRAITSRLRRSNTLLGASQQASSLLRWS